MNYLETLKKVRDNNNQWSKNSQVKIERALQKAYNDLIDLIDLSSNKPLQLYNYTSRKNAIAKLAQKLGVNISMNIKNGMYESAQDSISMQTKMYDTLAEKYGKKINWGTFQSLAPEMAVKNCISRVWGDENTFSKRVWNLTKLAKDGIGEILSSGIARGQSAIDMSRSLKTFLIDPSISPKWTTGMKPSVSGRGTINYNALRLARTEINNSYREARIIANAASPVTSGVKWNLSNSHPKKDICDEYAEADLYELGKGVYPADKVPIDHPNGLCFLTDVLRPPSEWDKPKYDSDKYSPVDKLQEDLPKVKKIK